MESKSTCPVTRRALVVDDYHGVKVADPYRWLEDDTSLEVQQWIDEQNECFQRHISGNPKRQDLKDRLTQLWHYSRCSVPEYVEGLYYAWRNNGLQNQSVLYRMTGLDDEGGIVFDPNLLSEDGTIAVESWDFSPKGNYLAYSLSSSGSDWQTIKVLNPHTGEILPDELHHVKFSDKTWLPDEIGFYYSRYPAPGEDTVLKYEARNSLVYLHMLGQEQAEDMLIHKDPEHPDWDFRFSTDENKKWAFMSAHYSTLFKNRLHFKLLAKMDSPWLPIAEDFEEGYQVIGVIEDTAYISTQKDAPFGKVMSLKLSESGASDMQTVIPDRGETLEYVYLASNHLICFYLRHATNRVMVFKPDGELLREVMLPAPGSVSDVSAKQDREEFFLQFTSMLYPASVLRCDLSEENPGVWFSPKIDFPLNDYETIQVFYPSKDGAQVPLFVTHRKGLQRNGSNPVLLYGYGGFNISMTPSFSVQILTWLENGGVWAEACLRGGGEYGEAWHKAGMLENKQNVFDDFIAAAEFLINGKYTSKEKLGIMGGSNGGLLTGACLTQRPDLYGSVVVTRPVLDMLRYHLFTAGRYWTGEYGCSDDPEQFRFLYKYSPLHNVKMNTAYPSTLIMTADTDDRVVPGQARKFAATLQAADAGENPIFVRIEKSAGHGHGMPVGKLIEEKADLLTFLLASLAG